MGKIIIRIFFAFLVVTNISAAEDSDIREFLSECLNIYNRIENIESERDSAAEDLNKKLQDVSLKIRLLQQPPLNEEKIRGINENITFYKNQIAKNKAYLEIAKITDPNERARLAEKYEQDRQRILKEELQANKPFRKRIDELIEQVRDKQKAFEDAMKKYCLFPEVKFPAIAAVNITVQYYNGHVAYEWTDANDKQFCRSSIDLKEEPWIRNDVSMLDNKFYISLHFQNKIEVWAGHFLVEFSIVETEWWGKEKITGYIKDFVDLDGLAKIDPVNGDSTIDILASDSLACKKRYHLIYNEWKDTTGPLTDERVKVKMLKSRLSKPPADSEQLQKDKDLIEYYTNDLERTRVRLNIGTITDANERAEMLSELEAEKQKLNSERMVLTKPYNDELRELTRGLREKDSELNDAVKMYFLKGPQDYGSIGKITTKGMFTKATMNCTWSDGAGNRLCSSIVRLRNRPVVPDDVRMLDGVYYISDGGGDYNYIWVWAGNFHVYFSLANEELHQKWQIEEIIKSFIDLHGLSGLLN